MAWTYEARMQRATAKLINTGRIDRVETQRRARFFDKYAFRVSLGVSLAQWVNFDELTQKYHEIFDPMGAHLVCVKNTFDIYIYGNNPAILTWLHKHPSVHINSLIQTDPASWHKKLPKSRKNVGKFFGEYRFRVRMTDIFWGVDPKNVAQLAELEMNHKMVLRKYHHSISTPGTTIKQQVRDTLIYVNKLNEVLVLKLMFGDQINDITERD